MRERAALLQLRRTCGPAVHHNPYPFGGVQKLRSKQSSTFTASPQFAYLQAPSSKLTVIWQFALQFGSLHIGSKFAKTYVIQSNMIAAKF
jgi:hypothetical protein